MIRILDIFLTNEAGDVVYSVYKEDDFCGNLRSEKYAGENIADSFSDVIAYQRFQISADELEMAEDIANE